VTFSVLVQGDNGAAKPFMVVAAGKHYEATWKDRFVQFGHQIGNARY
jgi:hypothetical protein